MAIDRTGAPDLPTWVSHRRPHPPRCRDRVRTGPWTRYPFGRTRPLAQSVHDLVAPASRPLSRRPRRHAARTARPHCVPGRGVGSADDQPRWASRARNCLPFRGRRSSGPIRQKVERTGGQWHQADRSEGPPATAYEHTYNDHGEAKGDAHRASGRAAEKTNKSHDALFALCPPDLRRG